ncbi:hypothetical protein EYM_00315 [Ignicoccus islandicus DSM 13165]|uniref:Xylose isomerase-like TIM barrel domain-containing protein n=1 Tax=Ignicoccus islandicus DSM 13165 TaxID=940295 RepID=A0A0U3F8Z2_9CREN|nr:sugar phosphate isomerase/epimerase [Ignicoccus islandicus]ALU12105.1 hypothetical protein EYM_00315 [Ignicoccus islandicus DSM 13165]
MLFGYSIIPKDTKEVEKIAKEIKEGGFNYLEISLDYPIPTKNEFLNEVISNIKNEGLKFSFHAPWRGIDLASPWEPLRKGAVKVIENILDIASRLEGMYVVIHLTTSERLSDAKDEIVNAAIESVKELLDAAKRLGIDFYIENVGKLGHPDILGHIMDETNAEFCLDIVHAIVDFSKRHKIDLERVDVDDVLETWKNSIGSNVKCMHIHGYTLDEGRLRIHTGLTYPITKRVAAKYITLFEPQYVTLEVFHSPNGPASPRFVAKELEEIKGWMKVYKRT